LIFSLVGKPLAENNLIILFIISNDVLEKIGQRSGQQGFGKRDTHEASEV